jgi:hypothetical protein
MSSARLAICGSAAGELLIDSLERADAAARVIRAGSEPTPLALPLVPLTDAGIEAREEMRLCQVYVELALRCARRYAKGTK